MNELMWKLFALLLQRYHSLLQSLTMMSNFFPSNLRLKQIRSLLEKGVEIKTILNRNDLEKEIAFYGQNLPLSQAITLALQSRQRKNDWIKQIGKQCGYPLILILFSFFLLTLYKQLVLPAISESLELNGQETELLLQTLNAMTWGKNMVLILFLLLMIIVLATLISKKENRLWQYLHRYHSDGLIRQTITLFFASRLETMLANGLKLDEALRLLSQDEHFRGIQYLASRFNNRLNHGEEFEKCLQDEYFDSAFYPLCLYGMKNESFVNALKDYCDFTAERIRIRLKRFSQIFSFFAIALTCCVILLCYQVMLLPLELLEGMISATHG